MPLDQDQLIRHIAKTDFNSGGVAVVFDVDDTLVPSGQHRLTTSQKDIMWGLHRGLSGGAMIATNNTLRKIDPMLKGFPAIGEHGIVWRLTPNTPLDKAELKSHKMDIPNISAFASGFLTNEGIKVSREDERHISTRGCVMEEKMATFAINFGHGQPELRQKSISACEAALKHFGIGEDHSLFVGPDSVEIFPLGFGKETIFGDLDKDPAFAGKQIIFFGDADGSDRRCMEHLAERNRGFGIAVGHEIGDGDHVLHRALDVKSVWNLLGILHEKINERPIIVPGYKLPKRVAAPR